MFSNVFIRFSLQFFYTICNTHRLLYKYSANVCEGERDSDIEETSVRKAESRISMKSRYNHVLKMPTDIETIKGGS